MRLHNCNEIEKSKSLVDYSSSDSEVYSHSKETRDRIEKSKRASSDTGTKKLPIEKENLEDFKSILSDSTCDEISEVVEKDTSDSEETIPKIAKFITSTLKAMPKVKSILESKEVKEFFKFSWSLQKSLTLH